MSLLLAYIAAGTDMTQHSIVQRLLKALRKKAAEKFIAQKPPYTATIATPLPGPVDGSGYKGPDPPTGPPVEPTSTAMRLIRRSTSDRQHRRCYQGNIHR
jgi:hypothetical protein